MELELVQQLCLQKTDPHVTVEVLQVSLYLVPFQEKASYEVAVLLLQLFIIPRYYGGVRLLLTHRGDLVCEGSVSWRKHELCRYVGGRQLFSHLGCAVFGELRGEPRKRGAVNAAASLFAVAASCLLRGGVVCSAALAASLAVVGSVVQGCEVEVI